MKKTIIKPSVVTENKFIKADGYNCISIINKGETDVFLEDNIQVKPDEAFCWDNDSDVIVETNITIRFIGAGVNKALIIKTYIK